MSGAHRLCLLVGLAAVSLAPLAHAQDEAAEPAESSSAESSSLKSSISGWHADADCISVDELRHRVDEQLSDEMVQQRSVHGEVSRSDAGWRVTLTVVEDGARLGERVLDLTGEDCRHHDETLALVIALLLEHGPPTADPGSEQGESPEVDDPNEPTPEPEIDQPAAEEPVKRPAEARPAPPVRLRTSVGFRGVSGWMPGIAWGPTLTLGAEIWQQWLVEAQGDFYGSQSADGPEGTSARMSGGRARLRTCFVGSSDGARFGALVCFGGGWMGLSVTGQGAQTTETALFGTPELGAGAGGFVRLAPRLSAHLDVDFMAPLRRGVFEFSQGETSIQVHETKDVLGSMSLGLALTF